MGFHGKFHGNYWDFNGVWWDLIGLLWTCVRFYCGWSSNQTRNIDGQPCQVGNYYQHLRILGAISRTHNLFTNTIKPWVWRHISLNTQCPCIILSSERGGNWKNLLTQSLTVVSFHKKERPHWLFQPVPATLEINILTWLSGLFFAMKNLAFSCQQNKKTLHDQGKWGTLCNSSNTNPLWQQPRPPEIPQRPPADDSQEPIGSEFIISSWTCTSFWTYPINRGPW